MTTSPESTISEGEIFDLGSEKATKTQSSSSGNSVNPQARPYRPLTRSPSPYQNTRCRLSRSRSRSPFRESRGTKRPRQDDLQGRLPPSQARRSKIFYEGEHSVSRRKYHEGHGNFNAAKALHVTSAIKELDVRHGPSSHFHGTSRSPEPYRHNGASHEAAPHYHRAQSARENNIWQHDGVDRLGKERDKFPYVQSVSDRGKSAIATTTLSQKAKSINDQKRPSSDTLATLKSPGTAVELHVDAVHSPKTSTQILDEAVMIEERRKRREAIKAKYLGRIRPTMEAKIVVDDREDNAATPAQAQKQGGSYHSPVTAPINLAPGEEQTSPMPNTGGSSSREASPPLLDLSKDLTKGANTALGDLVIEDDGPSAADYDPTKDMEEDQLRHDQRNHGLDSAAMTYEERNFTDQDVLLPNHSREAVPANVDRNVKVDSDFDMFADDDNVDMFAEQHTGILDHPKASTKAVQVPKSKALNVSSLDDWDDSEGYYKVILGELLDNRYHVQSNLGKGMFSGVVRAIDNTTQRMVAIKIIRNNETMRKAGFKEMDILQRLATHDPEDKKHVVRLEGSFEYKGHLCMVFENLSINLREVLKKFGRDVGINLKAVRVYAQQMFLGLSLLRRCNVLHADLKPDNILVNESRNLLKICDLGSASDASENEIAQYLVSRYYRAPEIILGLPYDFAIDVWSVGCTLFELYTGKILFTGRSNNQMLRAIMDARGKFSHKLLRRAHFAPLHFDDLLNFRSVEKDRVTGKDVVKVVNVNKSVRDLKSRVMGGKNEWEKGEERDLMLFVDLLDKCLNLNPEKRCTPAEALKHPFFTRGK